MTKVRKFQAGAARGARGWEAGPSRDPSLPRALGGSGEKGTNLRVLKPRRGTCGLGDESFSLGPAPRWKSASHHLVFRETFVSE